MTRTSLFVLLMSASGTTACVSTSTFDAFRAEQLRLNQAAADEQAASFARLQALEATTASLAARLSQLEQQALADADQRRRILAQLQDLGSVLRSYREEEFRELARFVERLQLRVAALERP